MDICATCGNEYDKLFEIIFEQECYKFDCFECAIHKMAPECTQCHCKIIGHGVEAGKKYYCGAHCAHQANIFEAKDHV